MGLALFRLGNFNEALKRFGRALELGCQKSEIPYYTGLSCFQTEDYAGAVKSFDKFLDTGVQDSEILQKRDSCPF